MKLSAWRPTCPGRADWQTASRGRRAASIAAALLSLWALLGFVAVPALLRWKAPEYLAETLGRAVRIETIRLNPFTLALSVRGLRVAEPDGSDLFALGELFVDLQVSSLFRRALTFAEVRLTAPQLHLRVGADGKPSFSDIFERLSADAVADDAQTVAPDEQAEAGEPFPIILYHAAIERGRVSLRDESRPTPFDEEISPIDFSLRDFSTRPRHEPDAEAADSPYAFTTTIATGATLSWQGTFSFAPLRSRGELRIENFRSRTPWRYLRDNFQFEITSGSANLSVQYAFDAEGATPQLQLSDGAFSLTGITVFADDVAGLLAVLPSATISGVSLDLQRKTVNVPTIASRGLRLRLLRDADGVLHVTKLLAVRDAATAADEVAKAEDTRADDAAWTIEVGSLDLADYTIDFEDRSTPTPAMLAIGPISLAARDFSTATGTAATVDLAVGLAGGGTIGVTGTVAVSPSVAANLSLTLADVALPLAQPYVEATSGAVIRSGTLGANLTVVHRGGDGEVAPESRAEGSLRLSGLDVGTRTGADVFRLETLTLEQLRARATPLDLSIARLELVEPELALHLRADGNSNLADLAVAAADAAPDDPMPETSEASLRGTLTNDPVGPVDPVEPADAADLAAPVPDTVKHSPGFAIDRTTITGGVLRLRDDATEPAFSLSVTDLDSTVEGVSLDPSARVRIDLDARVERTATLAIDADVTPRDDPVAGTIEVKLDGLDTAVFSPYSGRHVGRHIARGKIVAHLDYAIEKAQLEAANRVRLDAFTFGKRVESPDALDLPVGLAVALLKDVNGRIDLDVPVRGRLDDPEFSVGGVVWKALRDLILKAATAPFALIGGLVGGGDELGRVAFAPGSAELRESATDNLGRLARALGERPALRVEVPGAADPALDTVGLRLRALDDALRAMRFEEIRKKSDAPASAAEVELDEDLRARLLAELYVERFEESLRALRARAPERDEHGVEIDARAWANAEARRRLLAGIAAGESELTRLAKSRSDAIVEHLIDVAGVDRTRVSATQPTLHAADGVDEPYVELALTAD